jgi:hypothetical protein
MHSDINIADASELKLKMHTKTISIADDRNAQLIIRGLLGSLDLAIKDTITNGGTVNQDRIAASFTSDKRFNNIQLGRDQILYWVRWKLEPLGYHIIALNVYNLRSTTHMQTTIQIKPKTRLKALWEKVFGVSKTPWDNTNDNYGYDC